jgi:hypothetical protein
MTPPTFRIDWACPGCGAAWRWCGINSFGAVPWGPRADPPIVVTCRQCGQAHPASFPKGTELGGLYSVAELEESERQRRAHREEMDRARFAPRPDDPPPTPRAPPPPLTEEEQHAEAKRVARLVVSVVEHYNAADLALGRENRDIRTRLAAPIGRALATYEQRVPASVREATGYFEDALVEVLGGGDAARLGRG